MYLHNCIFIISLDVTYLLCVNMVIIDIIQKCASIAVPTVLYFGKQCLHLRNFLSVISFFINIK